MKILDKLGVIPNDINLFQMAFTHTSYANEHGVKSYERLEYLGDAILEFIMSDYLYKSTDYKEGDMTKIRAHYVCENALYEYSLFVGLNEYLRLGKGEEENGGSDRDGREAADFGRDRGTETEARDGRYGGNGGTAVLRTVAEGVPRAGTGSGEYRGRGKGREAPHRDQGTAQRVGEKDGADGWPYANAGKPRTTQVAHRPRFPGWAGTAPYLRKWLHTI